MNAVRRRERMMVAGGPGCAPGVEVDFGRPAKHADDPLEGRSLDALAAAAAMARLERKQNTLRGEDPAQQVANRDPDAHRAVLLGPRHAHQPREALRYLGEPRRIAHRTAGTKPGNRAGDDALVARGERFIAQPHRLHDARTKVVDYHVGL